MKKKILITAICITLNINSYGEVEGELQPENQTESQVEYKENYVENYEREEYGSMSTGKKIFYGGVGLGTAVGIVFLADELKTDDDGTTIEIGDKPEEPETPTPTIYKASEQPTSVNKDLPRTLLVTRDISRMYQDISMGSVKKEEDTLEVFIEGMEGKGEYTALAGGVYGIKTLKKWGRYKLKGSMAYSHTEVDYERGADGRADTLHTGLHLVYEQGEVSNYTWVANEFSYNKFEDEDSDNYSTNYLRAGNEISYELTGEEVSIRPFFMIEGGWLSMESIEVGKSKVSDEDYYSFRWGPGIEVATRSDRGVIGKIKVGYMREEGNIYDEFYIENTTNDFRIKDMEGPNSLEFMGEIVFKLKYGDIYSRGKYILREESDSITGTLGFRYDI